MDDDVENCERLARMVHEVDRYPPYPPDGDVGKFIRASDALSAWVAEENGEIVGHAALTPRSSGPVMALASQATGRRAEALAVVARLLVSPHVRRKGVGRALLTTAAAAAVGLGRWPVLDVARHLTAAIALYQACGWRCAGVVTLKFTDGTALDEYVFIAPDGASAEPLPIESL